MIKPPKWYYVVAGLAIIWALMGCYAYLSQVSMDAAELAQLPAAQREVWAMMPGWVKGAYAVAVWAGLGSAICLLIRLHFARTAYVISLAAVAVEFGWTFTATPILSTMGASAAIFPLIIAVIGLILVGFSHLALKRNWL